MKIGIIGASGKAGSLILKEALTRGHEVTAIVRDEAKVQIQGASVLEKDLFALKAEDIKEFDVVVNAFGAAPGKEHLHVDAGKILIDAMKGAPQTKLIVVGGAGSLFVDEAKTIRVLETPEFPKEYFATAYNQSKNLEDLQNATGIQWTFISPSAFFDPQGNRTGGYKLGKDNLLVNSKGESYVSYADFALAVLDEIENPQHINQRFTVVAEAE
ncbi:NAD(P)-dependent oxidoreductase [Peribacillus sp. NJ4]|uniref:NAD(P)-dependent oxidoreductase n=1 Tax=Peribacillus TaxID=2675229 RepID=UPI0025A10FAD|nr:MULTISPECIES: NAD(P)-dependent oxidoreductase [unclassified Peribacillus]MDM5210649.1 NAD(P)-dependent oxidoreductase [Peribacillus sp. NJ4]MDM5220946.1 NAD(P)-dependent oxidoreductase [Peribacillus sp. NJ11]